MHGMNSCMQDTQSAYSAYAAYRLHEGCIQGSIQHTCVKTHLIRVACVSTEVLHTGAIIQTDIEATYVGYPRNCENKEIHIPVEAAR